MADNLEAGAPCTSAASRGALRVMDSLPPPLAFVLLLFAAAINAIVRPGAVADVIKAVPVGGCSCGDRVERRRDGEISR
jgi:hypothetical protein